MNIHATPQRTTAEAALIEAFGERLSLLPGDGEVMVRRDAAVEALKAGLPTRRVEAWHYTDLRRLLTAVPTHDETAHAKPIAALLEGSVVLPALIMSLRNFIGDHLPNAQKQPTYQPSLERGSDV